MPRATNPAKHLASILGLFMITACERAVIVGGRIVDEQNQPVKSAIVSLREPGSTGSTFETKADEHGCFALGGMIAPIPSSWELSVSAKHSKPLKTRIRDGEYACQILLARAESVTQSSVKTLSANTAVPPCP
jgi:hypothetical protein